MRRWMIVFALLIVSVGNFCGDSTEAQETLTYVDLVRQMTDLKRLAVLPSPGEIGAMCSSYDRRSRYDADTGKYVDWFANNDGPQFIRTEGDRVVLAEMEGPGVLWRIWSALAEAGHVKIYLDGNEQPALDMPFVHFFDGKHAPFNYPSLSYQLEDLGCRGRNLYFPIPYQKSCKVVAEKGWGRYYQFTYTTLPPGTQVPTFTPNLSAETVEALQQVDTFFRDRLGTDPAGESAKADTDVRTIAAAPGSTASVIRLGGPRAITALRVKIDLKDREDQMAALRKLVLQIRFDGQPQPGVWCPLGDFFGTAPGVNLYKSAVAGMTEDGFYSFWYMPFAERGIVELLNEDDVARKVRFEITHAPLDRPFEGLGHFHAKWHRDVFPQSADRWPDWTVLRTQGRGRFCGMMLHVWNPRSGHCRQAGDGFWWWGEGDEKFFVDGEKFPSTFGTGTEDYFGYAWCDPGLFQRAYHNQTMTERNAGHQSVNRWQIADNVPFRTSFEGCLEKYFPNDRPTLDACVAYWYLSPDGVDPHQPVAVEERHGYYVRPIIHEAGFRVLRFSIGDVSTQELTSFELGAWKDNDHLWWQNAGPGDTLDLELPVKTTARQELSVVLTRAADYGIVQFHLDGQAVGKPIDLYAAQVTNTPPISLGIHQLTEGNHKLTVEIVGSNEKAEGRSSFGLDEIIFKTVAEPAE